MREVIERRIAEYLADDDPRFHWVRLAVRRYNFLPLYLGWVSSIGIRPDSSFIHWFHDESPDRVMPLDDACWQRIAICQGAKRYPELSTLIPDRPANGIVCPTCEGIGQPAHVPNVICTCGGAGWIISGERSVGGGG